eukprot:scaffold16903_cov28-Attheya_sp.AAC.2
MSGQKQHVLLQPPEALQCHKYNTRMYELQRTPNNTTVSGTHTQTNATQSRTPWVLVRCCPCDITAPHRATPFSYGDNTLERKATGALDCGNIGRGNIGRGNIGRGGEVITQQQSSFGIGNMDGDNQERV